MTSAGSARGDRASAWLTTVDGLRQGSRATTRAGVVREGRRIAAELGARHYVHDIDDTVEECTDFSGPTGARVSGPPYYLG